MNGYQFLREYVAPGFQYLQKPEATVESIASALKMYGLSFQKDVMFYYIDEHREKRTDAWFKLNLVLDDIFLFMCPLKVWECREELLATFAEHSGLAFGIALNPARPFELGVTIHVSSQTNASGNR